MSDWQLLVTHALQGSTALRSPQKYRRSVEQATSAQQDRPRKSLAQLDSSARLGLGRLNPALQASTACRAPTGTSSVRQALTAPGKARKRLRARQEPTGRATLRTTARRRDVCLVEGDCIRCRRR